MNMAVTYKHIDEMKPWSDKLHLLECISVTPETPDVMTFLFRSEDQNWFRYLPGQFVTLELPVGKEPLYRTYTLSSSPSRPYALSVTVKAQATSIGTRWMFDNLKPGMKIRARPARRFLLCTASRRQIPVHLGRLRRDADDVDGARHERPRAAE